MRLFYVRVGKRLVDIVLASAALALLAPVVGLVALAVRVRLGRPVFYKQTRGGLNGVPFELIKFRSMVDVQDTRGALLPDEARLTTFGRWLRRCSLDELPELVHVVRGEMSLVGPRPFMFEYMTFYSEREQARHSVRPGLTGLAQVKGRNALSWEQRFELDLEYVEEISILMDARILLETLSLMIAGSGGQAHDDNVTVRLDALRRSADDNSEG